MVAPDETGHVHGIEGGACGPLKTASEDLATHGSSMSYPDLGQAQHDKGQASCSTRADGNNVRDASGAEPLQLSPAEQQCGSSSAQVAPSKVSANAPTLAGSHSVPLRFSQPRIIEFFRKSRPLQLLKHILELGRFGSFVILGILEIRPSWGSFGTFGIFDRKFASGALFNSISGPHMPSQLLAR